MSELPSSNGAIALTSSDGLIALQETSEIFCDGIRQAVGWDAFKSGLPVDSFWANYSRDYFSETQRRPLHEKLLSRSVAWLGQVVLPVTWAWFRTFLEDRHEPNLKHLALGVAAFATDLAVNVGAVAMAVGGDPNGAFSLKWSANLAAGVFARDGFNALLGSRRRNFSY